MPACRIRSFIALVALAATSTPAAEVAVSYSTGSVRLVEDILVGGCCTMINAPDYDMFITEQDPGNNGSELRLTYLHWSRLGFSISRREFEDVTTNEAIRSPGGAPLSGTATSLALELRQPLVAGFELTGRFGQVRWEVEEPNSFGTYTASGSDTELDVGVLFRILESVAVHIEYAGLSSGTPFERGLWLGVQGSFSFGDGR